MATLEALLAHHFKKRGFDKTLAAFRDECDFKERKKLKEDLESIFNKYISNKQRLSEAGASEKKPKKKGDIEDFSTETAPNGKLEKEDSPDEPNNEKKVKKGKKKNAAHSTDGKDEKVEGLSDEKKNEAVPEKEKKVKKEKKKKAEDGKDEKVENLTVENNELVHDKEKKLKKEKRKKTEDLTDEKCEKNKANGHAEDSMGVKDENNNEAIHENEEEKAKKEKRKSNEDLTDRKSERSEKNNEMKNENDEGLMNGKNNAVKQKKGKKGKNKKAEDLTDVKDEKTVLEEVAHEKNETNKRAEDLTNGNYEKAAPVKETNDVKLENGKTNEANGEIEGSKKRKRGDAATNEKEKVISKPFQRVKEDAVEFLDERLKDNSYWAKDGAGAGWGAKAQEVLGQVKGRGFRHEKTKKKRGTYRGGPIDTQSHSIKFESDDDATSSAGSAKVVLHTALSIGASSDKCTLLACFLMILGFIKQCSILRSSLQFTGVSNQIKSGRSFVITSLGAFTHRDFAGHTGTIKADDLQEHIVIGLTVIQCFTRGLGPISII